MGCRLGIPTGMHIQVKDTHSTLVALTQQSAPVQVSQEFKPAQHSPCAQHVAFQAESSRERSAGFQCRRGYGHPGQGGSLGLWGCGISGVVSSEVPEVPERHQLPLQVTALNEQLSRLKASGLADVELLRFHAGVVKGVS